MMNAGDLDTMTRTVWGEARGESYEGKKAVAHVILNRFARKYRRRMTLTTVCTDPRQFSCWNADDPNLAKLKLINLYDADYRVCARAVLDAVEAHVAKRDPTKGSLHYHATSMGFPKNWGEPQTPAVRIVNHLFYNTVA
jgi:N-acetylmuramoyl-L-alanine amidase